MAQNPTIWSELYDPKEGLKLRDIPLLGRCEECGKYDGHQLDCTSVTVESMVRIVLRAQKNEEEARKRADRNWNMLTKYQGKLAVLKHENNKLRAANKKLKEGHHMARREDMTIEEHLEAIKKSAIGNSVDEVAEKAKRTGWSDRETAIEGDDMQLWILRPIEKEGDNPWEPWFDKAFGFVVRAETEDEARAMADADAGDENRGEFMGSEISKTKNPWTDAKYSTCEPLANDGDPGVVMMDFKSAQR